MANQSFKCTIRHMKDTLELPDLQLGWQDHGDPQRTIADFFHLVVANRRGNRVDIHGTTLGPGWTPGDTIQFHELGHRSQIAVQATLVSFHPTKHADAVGNVKGHCFLSDIVYLTALGGTGAGGTTPKP